RPEALEEPLHHGKRGEHLRELGVVGHRRRRLGVVLDEADDPVLADEPIETRRRRGRAEAGVGEGKLLFAWVEVELAPQDVVTQERALEATERGVQRFRRGVQLVVLPCADEVRAKRDAEGPIAEHETPLALAFGEHGGALAREAAVLEERVVRGQPVARGGPAPPHLTSRHHRCSPFHGGVASPVAYAMTRSVIFSSTQAKFASLIEKLSKSGAGLRKSIA